MSEQKEENKLPQVKQSKRGKTVQQAYYSLFDMYTSLRTPKQKRFPRYHSTI